MKYIVQIEGARTSFVVDAENADQAKSEAWEGIKDGYTYGMRDYKDFLAHSTAHRAVRISGGINRGSYKPRGY